ncbi:unnamed protein product [Paramecium sonneborni]|uniref:Transmembrane protein n=1 Tax=Paramecium sonneborni TaxID=65129 RepID=A0A8S1JZP7_9CILI|nr:unnamed protein product [Paramecium sonneborni]
MNYLSLIDIFGVEFKQQISLHVKSQKSAIGGITSLLILITSLGYFAYIMNEWVQYNLLPKSSNTMQVDDSSELIYLENESLFEFYYWKYSSHQVDPFNQQNNILTPLGVYFFNGQPQETFSFLDHVEATSIYGTKKFGLKELNLSQNSKNLHQKNKRELMLVFIKCNQTFLSGNQTCASEKEIDEFFTSAVNYIAFQISLKQFNSRTEQFEFVKKSFYFSIDKVIATQGQILLKKAEAFIDNGIILRSIVKETFVQDIQILTTSSSLNLWNQILGYDSYFNMIFRLDPISSNIQISYPKLGEVLAQVGSIVNVLMLLKYIILFYNEKLLENSFIDQVLSFYFIDYNQLKNSKEKKNKKLCSILVEQAQKKLIYINIIYELSRIQLFLQNHFGRKKVEESHKLGILLKSPNKNTNIDLVQEFFKCEENLNEENTTFCIKDFFLLSQPNKKLNLVEDQSLSNKYNIVNTPNLNLQIK